MIDPIGEREGEPLSQEHEGLEHAVLEIVIRLAQELHPAQELSDARSSDSLQDQFGIDSLGRAELAIRIERAFGARLPDSVVANAESPKDLVTALRKSLATGQGSAPAWRAPSFDRAPLRPRVPETEYPTHAKTLIEVLVFHAKRNPDKRYLEFVDPDERTQALAFGELLELSRRLGAGLQSRGLAPQEPVAIMLPTSLDFFVSFFSVLLSGGIPVPLYPPTRPSAIEDYIQRQSGILANCRARFLISTEESRKLSHLLRHQLPTSLELLSPEELRASGGLLSLPEIRPQDTAFLQYTSGSTGDPKGVILSHSNLLANIRSMGSVIGANSSDVFVSWLPLYHDMGLIGAFLGTLYHGAFLGIMSPISFLTHPSRWLRMIHHYRATLTAAPNFAYELCARRIPDSEIEGLDLSSWRTAFNGAEPVSGETIRRFTERFSNWGFRPEAMTPVYGLAESSVGLAFPRLGSPVRIERIKRGPFMQAGQAIFASSPTESKNEEDIALVGCGVPLPGHEFRIADPQGKPLPERRVGLIEFRGPSSTSGYFGNPKATRHLLRHAPWLDTGDLGFLSEGELFIAGRSKDVIIRAGRHIFPQELEEMIGDLPHVRKGCVAVFGVQDPTTGTERIIIGAETRLSNESERSTLQKTIWELSTRFLEVPADDVLLLPPRAIPKTSSGKLRRSECAHLYATHQLGKVLSPWQQRLKLAWSGVSHEGSRISRALLARLYAAYVYCLAFLITIPLMIGTFALPSLRKRFTHSRFWVRAFFALAGIRIRTSGLENLQFLKPPYLIVANHTSYVDALALVAGLPGTFRFIAKKEFESHPVFGPFFRRLGCIFVERFDPGSAIEDSRLLEKAAQEQTPLLIFPEGTFTAHAQLRPFRMGAFVTATRTGAPLVPVAIRGARAVLPPDQWVPHRGTIRLSVSSPIRPQTSGWDESLRLRSLTQQELERQFG